MQHIPFIRFNHLGSHKVVMSNIFGESMVLNNHQFEKYIAGIPLKDDLQERLEEKMFLKKNDNYLQEATKYYQDRNRINFIGPTLHIIVLTKGCNHQCKYCHAAADYRYTDESLQLKKEDAEKIVDIILSSPAKNLTIEFQGGEPTSNMEILEYIINYTQEKNKITKKNIHYALVTNLTLINEEMLEKLFTFPNLSLSTSLDGDKKVHDFNRIMISDRKSVSSYDTLVEKIKLVRQFEEKKGKKILYGAMGVISAKTLPRYKELVDTYIELGFNNIFLKKLNGLGFAVKTKNFLGYENEELLTFYRNYFDYLIEKNKQGIFINDGFLDIIIKKITTPGQINFMDLRSPCGAGIGQVAYDYTGKIYTCDEGRMTEDDVFYIGDTTNTLQELIQNDTVGIMMDASVVESLPCDVCAYAPFCGVCPVESYHAKGNIYTNQIYDSHCKFFMFLFDWVFEILHEQSGDAYEYLKKYLDDKKD